MAGAAAIARGPAPVGPPPRPPPEARAGRCGRVVHTASPTTGRMADLNPGSRASLRASRSRPSANGSGNPLPTRFEFERTRAARGRRSPGTRAPPSRRGRGRRGPSPGGSAGARPRSGGARRTRPAPSPPAGRRAGVLTNSSSAARHGPAGQVEEAGQLVVGPGRSRPGGASSLARSPPVNRLSASGLGGVRGVGPELGPRLVADHRPERHDLCAERAQDEPRLPGRWWPRPAGAAPGSRAAATGRRACRGRVPAGCGRWSQKR